MKIKSIDKLIVLLLVLGLTSCVENPMVVKAKVIEDDGNFKMSITPPIEFEKITPDSTRFFFNDADLYRILGGGMKKGDVLCSTSTFTIRPLLLENFANRTVTHQLLLRSFDSTMTIIDTHILSSYATTPKYSGQMDAQGKITRTFLDGTKEYYVLTDRGTFESTNIPNE
ncbi:MAG: hypothetical protein WBA16_05390 [Nonlabens sp.]